MQGVEVSIVQFDGKILDIEIPLTLSLEVAQTVRSPSQPTAPCAARRAWPKRARAAQDPGEKGNTAQGATKPATLETGAAGVRLVLSVMLSVVLCVVLRAVRRAVRRAACCASS